MEYKDFFKGRRIPSLAESLAKRCLNAIDERRNKQREFFWNEVIPEKVSGSNKAEEIEKKKITRAEMLQKWKAEKTKKLEEAKKKQKPIFKVGVVQRKATGSPLYSHSRTYARNNFSHLLGNTSHKTLQNMSSKEEKVGALTRARAKKMNIKIKETGGVVSTTDTTETKFNNMFYKIDKCKKQKINSHVFKVPDAVAKLPYSSLTFPYSPKCMRKTKKSVVTKENKNEVRPAEFEMQLKELKENLPKEQSSFKDIEESPVRTLEDADADHDDFRPIYYSPFVTVRSDKKKSGRKSKRKLILDVDEEILKEEKEFECRIFSFRKFIECETKRLLEMCDKWKQIYTEFEELPPDVEGDIDSVVGKTNLLTSDKFNQFKGLIEKCECGDPFVKIDDLQGFQDWVAIEVERIDDEFHRLEKRKNNGWKEPEQRKQPTNIKKTTKNTAKKPVGRSNIRAHIMAARKVLKEGNVNEIGMSESSKCSFGDVVITKTPTREQSLLKKVLSSDIKMKNESSGKKSPVVKESRNSGLEIMIATQKNKFPTPAKSQKSLAAADFEVFFGEKNTPSKSILKKTPKSCRSLKGTVTFGRTSHSGGRSGGGGGGLNEKYFRLLTDWDESPLSPTRTNHGDLNSGGMKTRSRTKQLSQSLLSPLVK